MSKLAMEKEIIENHRRYLEREAIYKSFGYDTEKEMTFIIEKAQPIYGNILDAGTGKGRFALALAKAGYKFMSFDISETEQEFAKLNLKYFNLDKQVQFHIENGEHLNFSDASFDIIFSVNVVHHLDNPYKFIDELVRVLTFEGKIILSDFTKEGFKMLDEIHKSEGRKHEVGKTTLSDVESYLKNKGFKTEKYETKFQEILVSYRAMF